MLSTKIFDRLKAIFPNRALKLSTFIEEQAPHQGFYMCPNSATQSSQMFEAYFLATKADWEKGGHVFVSSARAPEVLRILDRHGIVPTVLSWSEVKDISPWFSLMKRDGEVCVYVEDDSAPLKDRVTRFLAAQAVIRAEFDALHIPLTEGGHVNMNQVKAWLATGKMPIMFVELGQQTKRGFSVIIAQLRRKVGFCIINRTNEFDQGVGEIFGKPAYDEDEQKSLMANMAKVYGSGQMHNKDLSFFHERSLEYKVPTEKPDTWTILKHKPSINIDRLYHESDLGLAFGAGGQPQLVDLSL